MYILSEIGSAVCNLDHSSVIHYRGKLLELYDIDKDFRKKFIDIEGRFKQIKQCGLPVMRKLDIAIQERNLLNEEIRKMRRILKV